MEDAIRIVVIMFVAVTVGGVILLFSQRTITDSEEKLYNFDIEKDDAGLVTVTLPTDSTVDDVSKLVEACVQKASGEIEGKECFVVKGTIPVGIDALDGTVIAGVTVGVSISGTPNAIFINYDPQGEISITA